MTGCKKVVKKIYKNSVHFILIGKSYQGKSKASKEAHDGLVRILFSKVFLA